MLKSMRKLARNKSGAAAVEFALTVPILLFALLGVVDLGRSVYQRADMESALRAGIQYFMNGGSDLTLAQQIVNESWTTKPQGVTVVADQVCFCGTAVSACNAVCSGGAYPVSFNRLSATAVFPGILVDNAYSAQQTVRVR
jgi:Flp pilus assembly protein TadG